VPVRKAIIPAAGLGTRFLPATKAVPKEMLPIVDKPAIQYTVEEAAASGIEQILIISATGKGAIEDHFDRSVELETALRQRDDTERLDQIEAIAEMAEVFYIRQKAPLGLGHAVAAAASFVGDEPFAVLLGDDIVVNPIPCLRQLLDIHEQYGTSVVGVQEVGRDDVSKYGIVDGDEVGRGLFRLTGVVEKPAAELAPSRMAVMGRYVITPALFPILSETAPGIGGEVQLTDALNTLLGHEAVYAAAFSGRRYDVGSKQGFLEANVEMALGREDVGPSFRAYLQHVLKTI